jgi:flagellin
MSATIAQNSLVKNERMMSKAMEQLSTGRRINSAADDAAGMAIASKMTSQIKGLDQAVRNANDAISMIQTADGAYSEVENMLQRMRELAVQSATDSYSDTQRGYADTEFAALKAQIASIGSNTQFNGAALLDGTVGTATFHIGASAGQTMTYTFSQLSGGTAQSLSAAVVTAGDAGNANVIDFDMSGVAAVTNGIFTVTANGTTYTIDADVDGSGDATINSVTGAGGATGLVQTPTLNSSSGNLTFSVNADGDIEIEAANNGALTINSSTLTYAEGTGGVYGTVVSSTISSRANADTAITTLETALATVQSARAGAGATMNRLQYASDNLANEAANTQAARSGILDADYATATTELARTQIIQQAGTAMLAQANQLPQTVLSLLQ